MRFARAVALITGFTVATRGLGFVFRIILAQMLGAEMLGVYQIAFSFFLVFLTAIASGLPLIISRQVSSLPADNKRQRIRGIITSGLIISLTLSVAIILLVYTLQGPFSHLFTDDRSMHILLIFIPAILATSIYTVLRAVWWGQKRFFMLGATELSEIVARLTIFFIMLAFAFAFTDMASMAALSFTISCVISATIVVILYLVEQRKTKKNQNLKKQENYKKYTYEYLKPQLKSATPITTVRVITSVALPLIAIIIPMRLVTAGWSASEAVAAFGIAVGMTLPLLSIPQTVISSMSTALVPELSSALKQRDFVRINTQISNCIKYTLFINFLLIPPFIAVGTGIGQFLFANERAGIYLAQSAWIMIPMSLSLITNAILNSLGAETRAMMHYVIGSAFLFICVWFLPQFIGVGALIVGLGICMSIAGVLNIIQITRITKTETNFVRQLVALTLITIPSAMLGRFAYMLVTDHLPLFFSISLGGAVALGGLLLLAHTFKIVDFRDMKTNLLKRKSKRAILNNGNGD